MGKNSGNGRGSGSGHGSGSGRGSGSGSGRGSSHGPGGGNGAGLILNGTSGNDYLNGGNDDDQLYGGAGNDRLNGGKGNDTIDGGTGNDRIDGGDGNDTIFGRAGNDNIEGGKGSDTIEGGAGNDQIDGGSGIDTAVYSGNFRDYKLTLSRDGGHSGCANDDRSAMTVHDKRPGSPDGVDVLKNVEILRFADGYYVGGVFYGGNAAPTDIALSNSSVAENAAGAVVGSLSVVDPDFGDTHSYAIDDARFEVVAGQLKLKSGVSLDFEAGSSTPVLITVTDAGGLSRTEAFTITVIDVNEAPTVLALSNNSVAENAAGAVIGTLTTIDPDSGDTHSYVVDDGRFEVVAGQLKLKAGQSLDYEASPTVTLTVTATDAGGLSKSQAFTIDVTDVADANHVPTGSATAVLADGMEDTAYTVYAADLLAGFSDEDGDTLSVSGLTASNGMVTDNGDGTYTITPTADFNGAVTLSYVVNDGRGGSVGATQGFSLAAVNDAPTTTPATLTAIAEDSGARIITQAELLVGAGDVDSPSLSVTDLTISAGGGALVDNPDGTWTYMPLSDDDTTVTFSYTVTDGVAGTAGSATLDITPVNDAPVAQDGSAAGNEDTVITGQAVVTDIDNSQAELTYSLVGNAQYGTVAMSADGSFTYTPDANYSGPDSFTFKASDGNVESGVATINLTVAPVADAPIVTVSETVLSGDEDTGIPIDISAVTADGDGSETLTVEIDGVPAGAAFVSLRNGVAFDLETDSATGTQVASIDDAIWYSLVHGQSVLISGLPAGTTLSFVHDGILDSIGTDVSDLQDGTQWQLEPGDLQGLTSIATMSLSIGNNDPQQVPASIMADGVLIAVGQDAGAGKWVFSPDELAGLRVVPPNGSIDTLNLSVTGVATDGTDAAASTPQLVTITLAPVVDTPIITVNGIQVFDAGVLDGREDQPIALDFSVLTGPGTDVTAATLVTISGIPDFAELGLDADHNGTLDTDGNGDPVLAGVLQGNGDWLVPIANLSALTAILTPDSDQGFTITASVTATQANQSATKLATLHVDVTAVADLPTLEVQDAGGSEDTPIALSISGALTDNDGSESLSYLIGGVPAGGEFRQDQGDGTSLRVGQDQGDGSWLLYGDEVTGLYFVPSANRDGTFDLTVRAIATEGSNGDVAFTESSLRVTVEAVADAPLLSIGGANAVRVAVVYNDHVPFNEQGLPDIQNSQAIATVNQLNDDTYFNFFATAVAASDANTLAELSEYDVVIYGGNYWDGASPGYEMPAGYWETLREYMETGAGGVVTTGWHPYRLTEMQTLESPDLQDADAVSPIANAPNGYQSSGIAAIDGGHSITEGLSSVDLSDNGLQVDWQFTTGLDAGAVALMSMQSDKNPDETGYWSGTGYGIAYQDVLPGRGVYLGGMYTDEVFANEVLRQGIYDQLLEQAAAWASNRTPIAGSDVIGFEDAPIALPISAALADSDTSETLSILISDVPEGASLSAGDDNGDGTWTLTAAQLIGLQFIPAPDFNGDVQLYVTATAIEAANGDQNSSGTHLSIYVTPGNDAPVADNARFIASADAAISGYLTASDIDGDALAYSLGALNGENGVATVSPDGLLSYVANVTGFIGTDSVSFNVGDGFSGTGTGSISITIVGVEDDLIGGAGVDHLLAGSGAIQGDEEAAGGVLMAGLGGADVLVGGVGFDTADYSASAAGVTVSLATGTGAGGDAEGDSLSGIEAVIGSAFDDVLTGADAGFSLLNGGVGADTLNGGAGSDYLIGEAGVDTLSGGAGFDLLQGGAGNDLLTGGEDGNIFAFVSAADGVDTISDFTAASGDSLQLLDVLQGYTPTNDLVVDAGTLAEFIKLFETGGGTTVRIDADGSANGSAFADLAILQGVTGLTLEGMLSNFNLQVIVSSEAPVV